MRGLLVVGVLLVACSSPPGEALTFDPCERLAVVAPEASDEQQASIDDAIAMWRAEGLDIARADAGAVAIVFRPAAASFYGYYDAPSATIYVNLGLADRAQRAIAIAHELGHAFALVHVPPGERISVMNPGNLETSPAEGDRAALIALWGECSAR